MVFSRGTSRDGHPGTSRSTLFSPGNVSVRYSHFTCEYRSMLTRACRKPEAVAFALHLSTGGSATYSRIGGKPLLTESWGSHEAIGIDGGIGAGVREPGACL